MSDTLRLGVAGLGTVGTGTLAMLQRNPEMIAQRCGRPVRVTAVAARDPNKTRDVDLSGVRWTGDARELARDPEVDVLVELIGGGEVVETALARGKHVVTANKALLARHGTRLAREAEAHGAGLLCEAAVCGGIPVIKTVREALAGNAVTEIHGIMNGTSNYILTDMRETGRDFGEVLAETQQLGYAEADPAMDVDGHDAAHKLAILTALAFNREIDSDGMHVEGIRQVNALDIAFAEQLGYRIKLLGIARAHPDGVEQRVHPCMVPKSAPIAGVEGVNNAVVAAGDAVGSLLTEGPGAGAGPTASAVVADVMDLARCGGQPTFAVPAANLAPAKTRDMTARHGEYYLRLMCEDRPGVLTEITEALRDEGISVASMVQRGRAPAGRPVPVVMTTHETQEAAMMRALARIGKMPVVLEPPRLIRVENV